MWKRPLCNLSRALSEGCGAGQRNPSGGVVEGGTSAETGCWTPGCALWLLCLNSKLPRVLQLAVIQAVFCRGCLTLVSLGFLAWTTTITLILLSDPLGSFPVICVLFFYVACPLNLASNDLRNKWKWRSGKGPGAQFIMNKACLAFWVRTLGLNSQCGAAVLPPLGSHNTKQNLHNTNSFKLILGPLWENKRQTNQISLFNPRKSRYLWTLFSRQYIYFCAFIFACLWEKDREHTT